MTFNLSYKASHFQVLIVSWKYIRLLAQVGARTAIVQKRYKHIRISEIVSAYE